MTWICPKCGNKNKNELDNCFLCHLGKLGNETYQKRIYMDRSKPDSTLGSSMAIITGIMMPTIGLVFLCIAFFMILNLHEKLFIHIFGCLGFISIYIGFCFIIYVIKKHKVMNEFKKGTTVIDATVLGRNTAIYDVGSRYGGISVSYYIDIRFDVSEKQYFINAKVNKKFYERAERGKLLSVAYANSDPCVLLFEGED